MNIIRIFLIISNGFFALVATLIFFLKYRFRFWQWLMINTCTPSVVAFIYGALTINKVVLGVAFVLMFFYSTLGLFIFSWQGKRVFAQIGHLFMTAACCFVLFEIMKGGDFVLFAIGTALGVIILIPFNIYQRRYFSGHPKMIKELKDSKFERLILG